MAEKQNTPAEKVQHGTSSKIQQKEQVYEAEYLGSGTFKIIKPKRQARKRRQSALKARMRGGRK